MPIPKYYKSENEFKKIHHKLKLYKCPYCNLIGFLILHGYQKGYDKTGRAPDSMRGHRIFCSNRKKRNGCGRTICILLSSILKHFTIDAGTLWDFINFILKGHNKAEGFRNILYMFSISTAYRLWSIFCFNQSFIRTLLHKISKPPDGKNFNPLLQTIEHLKIIGGELMSPISSFQHRFQSSIFKYKLPEPGIL